MPRVDKPLGEILKEKKLITDTQLQEALQEAKRTGEFLGKILVRKGYILEKDLISTLAEQFNLKTVSLKYKYIDYNFLKSFSQSLILDFHCLPIEANNETVTFAITNPLDAWVIKKAEEEAKGLKVRFVLVSETDMEEAISRYKEYLKRDILKRI